MATHDRKYGSQAQSWKPSGAHNACAENAQAMKNLTLDDFALFVELAGARSLSSIARDRQVTPGQMSRALARIESNCGLRLVHRTTHTLSLTDEGEIFLDYARRFVADQQNLQDSFGKRRHSVVGTVRISVSQLLAEQVLIPRIRGLRSLYPDLSIDLHLEDRLVSMADEAVDIAIRAGVAPAQTAIARTLGCHGRGLYASPDYLKKHGTPKTPDDLQAHTLISNTASFSHNRWAFVVDGVASTMEVSGQLRVNSSAAVLLLALANGGIARINDVIARRLVQDGRLKPVLPNHNLAGEYWIYAVILAARNRAPKIRAAVDYLEGCFADFRQAAAG
jgi:DNA-binding transcriptional LysR family regulator